MLRTETRGSHYRIDHPGTDAQWDCPVQVELRDGRPVASRTSFSKA
jgi:succinate dehydrogenase/fumarate reductase flavoprotein subunit